MPDAQPDARVDIRGRPAREAYGAPLSIFVSLAAVSAAEARGLDAVSNADVLVVDQTHAPDRTFLGFQLALREHVTHKPALVLLPEQSAVAPAPAPAAAGGLHTALYLQVPARGVSIPVQDSYACRGLGLAAQLGGPVARVRFAGDSPAVPLAVAVEQHLQAAQDDMLPSTARETRFREVTPGRWAARGGGRPPSYGLVGDGRPTHRCSSGRSAPTPTGRSGCRRARTWRRCSTVRGRPLPP